MPQAYRPSFRLVRPRQQDHDAHGPALQAGARLGIVDHLARPAMPGDGCAEVEAIAIGNRVRQGLRIREVSGDRRVHLIVGDGRDLESLPTVGK